jgi:uncharacterized phage protein (TIGR02218 family)
MTFSTLERSRSAGRPIQLYQFARQSGDTTFYWRYNGADEDLTYLSQLYSAVSISDDGIRLTGEAASAEFTVTLPSNVQFCDDFRGGGASPSDSIYLSVWRCHAGDIDPTNTIIDAMLVWTGTVDGLTQTNDTTVSVTCSMLAASFKRSGLRYTWMKNCPHVLYAPLTCKANKDDFRIDAVVDTAHGNTVTSTEFSAQPDGWLTGGYIEYLLPSGFLERRMILRHQGESLRTLGPVVGIAAGDPVVAYAGCKRTVRECIDKFDNYDNYGGFPHIPGRSPYDGNPVF